MEQARFGDFNKGLVEGNALKLVQFDQPLCKWGAEPLGEKESDTGIGTQGTPAKPEHDGTIGISAFETMVWSREPGQN